jgi:hypothetical protein
MVLDAKLHVLHKNDNFLLDCVLIHRWAQSATDRWIDTNSIDRYYQSILAVYFS